MPKRQTTLFGHFQQGSSSPPKPTAESPKRKRRTSPQYEDMSPSAPRTTRSGSRKQPQAKAAAKGKGKGKQRAPSVLGTDSDSEEPEKIRLEPPRRRKASSSDGSDVEALSPKRPSPKKRRIHRIRPASSEDSDILVVTDRDEGKDADVDKENHETARIAYRTRRLSHTHSRILDSDDEDSKAKARVKNERPPTSEEDLEDEVDKDHILNDRLRNRGKRSTYLQNLEKLKRKKQGNSSPIYVSEEDEDDDEDDDDESEEDEGNHGGLIPGARPTVVSNGSNDDEDADDDFIVEDDSQQAAYELPAEFSMDSHQDLLHNFKIICQMFVHAAIAEDRELFMEDAIKKQYFGVPLQATRKKLMGIRDSLVASSMWKPAFKKPLETYPELEISQMDFAVPGCDACHMGARLSTRVAHLTGERYYERSYEPQGSSADEDSDNDEQERVQKSYNLGRFCARRTRAYHNFNHWEYKLFHALLAKVTSLHKSKRKGFVVLTHTDGRQPPNDLTNADEITEYFDKRGFIDEQYQILKKMIDGAHDLEVRTRRGEDDGDD